MNDELARCLRSLYGLRRFGIKLGLETIREMLAGLGDPQTRFRSIHLAGSNGKGSVASALATILGRAGYRVGLYTSPHLVRFNERFCIDGRPVSDEALLTAHEAVRRLPAGDRSPTFFEFATAMAFHIFAEAEVDWAVVETGMGGRLDATNVLVPELSVITNVSMEHEAYLGATLAAIAAEKGGIVKPKTPVVVGVREAEAVDVIDGIAAGLEAPLFRLGEHFRAVPGPDGLFRYEGVDGTMEGMRTALSGGFQVENAALVLASCELIARNGANLSSAAMRAGLAENRWPGRQEVVAENPTILLDGAHNLAAARHLAAYLRETFADRSVTLVAGILDDKPYREMLAALLPVCRRVVLTRARNERALPPEILREVADGFLDDVTIAPDVASALASARARVAPTETVCVAGSLYVVGEAKEALESEGISAFDLASARRERFGVDFL